MRSFAVVLALFFVGCTSSPMPLPSGPDAAVVADAQAAPINALGQACANDDACPRQHGCVFLASGNPDVGYCSPICLSDEDCRADYTGPSTGTPTCFVPDQAARCSITCDTTADCPLTLTCMITGGAVNVCATP